jgi:hypothetical protein
LQQNQDRPRQKSDDAYPVEQGAEEAKPEDEAKPHSPAGIVAGGQREKRSHRDPRERLKTGLGECE